MRGAIVAGLVAAAVGVAAAGTAGAQAPTPPAAAITVAAPSGPLTVSAGDLDHLADVVQASLASEGATAVTPADAADQAVRQILSATWTLAEGDERGLTASDAHVEAELRRMRQHGFDSPDGYQQFLASTHMTDDDIRRNIQVNDTAMAIRRWVTAPIDRRITAAVVTRWLRRNPQRVGERRVLRWVRAGSAAAARRRWRRTGGRIEVVQRGTEDLGPSERRVFHAVPGRLVGPVRSGGDWIMFRVVQVRPPGPMAPAQARSFARWDLRSQADDRALKRFARDFEHRWAARTTCADGTAYTSACRRFLAKAAAA